METEIRFILCNFLPFENYYSSSSLFSRFNRKTDRVYKYVCACMRAQVTWMWNPGRPTFMAKKLNGNERKTGKKQ